MTGEVSSLGGDRQDGVKAKFGYPYIYIEMLGNLKLVVSKGKRLPI